jgi:phosphomannomutase/phosphoglucomutase
VYGESLTNEYAQLLGQALGSRALAAGESSIAIGRDARKSGKKLVKELTAGILSTGCDVVDLGEVSTPLVYFSTHTTRSHSGVMVTGSHNPPEYNGFKIVIAGQPLAEEELKRVREEMLAQKFKAGQGSLSSRQLLPTYIDKICGDVQLIRPRKVVVDGGNGVGGKPTAMLLEKLGCEVIELYCKPDGNFPNHHPDPSKPENMQALIKEVLSHEADLGLALDGDGDRLGVVDNKGRIIESDLMIMLLAEDILTRNPGVDIIYDVKSSAHIAAFVLEKGGRPVMWKTGHTRIKEKMKETNALLGGEFSGHFYIKERWYGFDDAVYTAARLLEILGADSRPANEVFDALPRSVSTPEIQLEVEEGQNFVLMQAMELKANFEDADIITLDGLRVEFSNGWGLVRPSNTTAALVFRFEADDQAALAEIKTKMRGLVDSVAPELHIPF